MNYSVSVISLKDEIERRKSIAKQLNLLGIEFDFFDAADLRKMNTEDAQSLVVPDKKYSKPPRPLTKGEVGCAMSHIQLLTKLSLNKSLDYHLILEDDAILDERILCFLNGKTLNTFEWDVIILGYSKLAENEKDKFYIKEPIKKVAKFSGVNIGCVWKEWTCGTVGYLINRKCLHKFIDLPISSAADDWQYLKDKLNLKVYHTRPLLISEAFMEFNSTIENDRAVMLKKNIRSLELFRFIRGIVRKLLFKLIK
ncbi:glycosyltransferase family 25 protein [Vibrio mimicus]